MKEVLCIVALLLYAAVSAHGQQLDPIYGQPSIVLIESNPWLMVIGSDTPTFVLYEKGQVIYKRRTAESITTYEVKLTPEERQKLINALEITDAFYKLPKHISASGWTDQPTNILFVNIEKPKQVSVYGNLRGKLQEGETAPPKEFLTIYNQLINFRQNGEQPWAPKVMEVMFWDYSYAPNKKPWPKGLPDLNTATSRESANGMYSVFLDRSQFEEYKKFSASLGEKTAVEINGKKMTMSARYPFPNLD
jgi:hypothetical protein